MNFVLAIVNALVIGKVIVVGEEKLYALVRGRGVADASESPIVR
jgi:hypothetical protein